MSKKELQLKETVWKYYSQSGRHTLPWRSTKDPYRILVSEIMLQQTQVERVIPKFKEFLRLFPTVLSLSQAPLREILIVWQGLGYNRRARMLHECAKKVVVEYNGKFPDSPDELQTLPGVGPYTCGAILAFAFNTPTAFIETNIRSVFLHHFFKDCVDISDTKLMSYIASTMDIDNPREWYYALMDYGAHLKKTIENPNRKSANYTKQSAFKGSDRQIRGAIVRTLSAMPHTRKKILSKLSSFEDIRVDAQITKLLQERIIEKNRTVYQLPS